MAESTIWIQIAYLHTGGFSGKWLLHVIHHTFITLYISLTVNCLLCQSCIKLLPMQSVHFLLLCHIKTYSWLRSLKMPLKSKTRISFNFGHRVLEDVQWGAATVSCLIKRCRWQDVNFLLSSITVCKQTHLLHFGCISDKVPAHRCHKIN